MIHSRQEHTAHREDHTRHRPIASHRPFLTALPEHHAAKKTSVVDIRVTEAAIGLVFEEHRSISTADQIRSDQIRVRCLLFVNGFIRRCGQPSRQHVLLSTPRSKGTSPALGGSCCFTTVSVTWPSSMPRGRNMMIAPAGSFR